MILIKHTEYIRYYVWSGIATAGYTAFIKLFTFMGTHVMDS